MRDKNLNLIFCLLFALFAVALPAQERIGLSVNRNDVLVGDLIELKIEIQVPPNARILGLDLTFNQAKLLPASEPNASGMVPVPEGDTYPDFDIKSTGKWETIPDTGVILKPPLLEWDTLSNSSTTILVNTLEIIPWDAGTLAFTPMILEFDDNGETRRVTSNVIELKVNAVVAPATTTQIDSLGFAPIKEIKREPFKLQDIFPYLLGLLVLGFLGVLFWIMLREKQVVVPPPPLTRWVPVHELALAELNALNNKQLWQQGEVKTYHSELTRTVRAYLENRYHIQALESPTSEILRQMKPLGFTEDHKNQLQEMLQMADMVKFAKAQPDVEVHSQLMNTAMNFIQTTKPTQLVDEEDKGWIELTINEDKESVIYQLITNKDIRKRVLENAHDFIKFEEAPLGRRFAAALIDGTIFSLILVLYYGVIIYMADLIATEIHGIIIPIVLFWGLAIIWGYFVELEVRNGLTPGKRLLSLQTMNAQQNNISRMEALIRWISKAFAVLLFPLFIIYTLVKKSKVLFHDGITDTRVYFVKK